jgi:hypothetical protein
LHHQTVTHRDIALQEYRKAKDDLHVAQEELKAKHQQKPASRGIKPSEHMQLQLAQSPTKKNDETSHSTPKKNKGSPGKTSNTPSSDKKQRKSEAEATKKRDVAVEEQKMTADSTPKKSNKSDKTGSPNKDKGSPGKTSSNTLSKQKKKSEAEATKKRDVAVEEKEMTPSEKRAQTLGEKKWDTIGELHFAEAFDQLEANQDILSPREVAALQYNMRCRVLASHPTYRPTVDEVTAVNVILFDKRTRIPTNRYGTPCFTHVIQCILTNSSISFFTLQFLLRQTLHCEMRIKGPYPSTSMSRELLWVTFSNPVR